MQQHEGLRARGGVLWWSYFSKPRLSLWESGLERERDMCPDLTAFYRRGHCWWVTGNNQDNQLLCCLYRDTIEPVSNTYSTMYLSCSWTTGHFIMLYFDQSANRKSVSWAEPARLVSVTSCYESWTCPHRLAAMLTSHSYLDFMCVWMWIIVACLLKD